MKVLIDECVDQRLRLLLVGHDRETAAYVGLSNLKNGVLLAAAERTTFDLMITTDQAILSQQNLGSMRIAIVILCAATNRLTDRKPLVPAALRQWDEIQPG